MFYDKNNMTLSEKKLREMKLMHDLDVAQKQIDQAQKMYDYYKNDRSGILNHLETHLSKIVNPRTLKHMPLVWVNEVPRIVRRLAQVYKEPATRNPKDEKYAELTKKLRKASKEFNRQGKLFNTVLVRPIYNELTKMFDYVYLARNEADVDTDPLDENKMTELRYNISYPNKQGDLELYTIHWTDENHWATDQDDREVMLDFMPEDQTNPYGVNPFAVLRFEESSEFWGDGLGDLVDSAEVLNGRLTDMIFKQYMSFGIPVGTNLNIKKEEFYISPDTPLLRDNAMGEELEPNLKFATPDHKVDIDMEINDWFKKELANTRGLPQNGVRYTSGFEREIDHYELLDMMEDDKDVLREFEHELHEKHVKVAEVDANVKLSPELEIEFAPFDFPRSPEEQRQEDEFKLQYNLISVYDLYRREHPDADDEEIEAELKKNKEVNVLIKPGQKPSIFDRLNESSRQNTATV